MVLVQGALQLGLYNTEGNKTILKTKQHVTNMHVSHSFIFHMHIERFEVLNI